MNRIDDELACHLAEAINGLPYLTDMFLGLETAEETEEEAQDWNTSKAILKWVNKPMEAPGYASLRRLVMVYYDWTLPLSPPLRNCLYLAKSTVHHPQQLSNSPIPRGCCSRLLRSPLAWIETIQVPDPHVHAEYGLLDSEATSTPPHVLRG